MNQQAKEVRNMFAVSLVVAVVLSAPQIFLMSTDSRVQGQLVTEELPLYQEPEGLTDPHTLENGLIAEKMKEGAVRALAWDFEVTFYPDHTPIGEPLRIIAGQSRLALAFATRSLHSTETHPVRFSFSGLPHGVRIVFTRGDQCTPDIGPASSGSCFVFLNVETTTDAAVGTSTITLTGQGGGLTRTSTYQLIITRSSTSSLSSSSGGDFRVTVAQSHIETTPGGSVRNVFTVHLTDPARPVGEVQGSAWETPFGLYSGYAFWPSSCTPNPTCTMELRFSTRPTSARDEPYTVRGDFTLRTAPAGPPTRSAEFTVQVAP